ncbi:MAG: DUF3800 domain-containing protein [Firmicutes bacterium]|nr:DUF3800 domain-containing protein [Bacillota bacterium]
MKVFIYLDESGSIHKNSKTRYFAIGGYFTFEEEKIKIIAKYKRFNYELKKKYNINLNKEIKSYNMTQLEKIEIFSKVQSINSFNGCVKVFDKIRMQKEILHSNIFFNYGVKLLILDCIIPLLDKDFDECEFYLNVDNRNVGVGNLKNLENYLSTEFILNNYKFKVTYFDSRTNYGIQLADLIVNTFYNYYKDKSIIREVIPHLDTKKFKVSSFPKSFKIIDNKYSKC